MAIYFKFKSAKTYNSVSVNGPSISVASLKRKIIELIYKSKKKADSNGLCMGTDFDILIINAHTNDHYDDDDMLIPIQTRVLIQRVPGTRRHKPIDTTAIVVPGRNVPTSSSSFVTSSNSSSVSVASNASVLTSITNCGEEKGYVSEYDDLFGDDIYLNVKPIPSSSAIEGVNLKPFSSSRQIDGFNAKLTQSSNLGVDDEDKKIQALVNTPALDWQLQGSNGANSIHFPRMDKRLPPEGYICHRCQLPGHFIQHCPTNGNPDYDFKKVRPPTGIPKSMLMANPDGSAVVQANDASFDKQMEGLNSNKLGSANDFPPELLCPLCKHVMKSAVLTSKCCFSSFCDKCMRDHLLASNLKCVCGAVDMLTDFLIPNLTVRNTINSLLESGSGNSSMGDNAKTNSFKVNDMESARVSRLQTSSTLISAASCDKKRKPVDARELRPNDVTEATSGFTVKKEPAAATSFEAAESEVEKRKVVSDEMGKKKKKRKISRDVEAENYVVPYGYYPFNPYWGNMQIGIEGYGNPYYGVGMSYGLDPFGMPFNGSMPQNNFSSR